VSRKVGGAVVRNRIKRRIREWFRKCSDRRVGDFDIVVIARTPAAELDGMDAQREVARLTRDAIGYATL
jgi:ribonuclease P protein component